MKLTPQSRRGRREKTKSRLTPKNTENTEKNRTLIYTDKTRRKQINMQFRGIVLLNPAMADGRLGGFSL